MYKNLNLEASVIAKGPGSFHATAGAAAWVGGRNLSCGRAMKVNGVNYVEAVHVKINIGHFKLPPGGRHEWGGINLSRHSGLSLRHSLQIWSCSDQVCGRERCSKLDRKLWHICQNLSSPSSHALWPTDLQSTHFVQLGLEMMGTKFEVDRMKSLGRVPFR